MTFLLEHQKPVWDFVEDKNNFGLFLCVGAGKSKIIIDKLSHLYKQKKIYSAVIVAPKTLLLQWEAQQIPLHTDISVYSHIFQNKKSQKYIEEFETFCVASANALKILLINYEYFQRNEKALQYFLLHNEKTFVCYDEATAVKTFKAKQTRTLLSLHNRYKNNIIGSAILTGTPASENVESLFSLMNFIIPWFWGKLSFLGFQKRYCIKFKGVNHNIGRHYSQLINPLKDSRTLISQFERVEEEKITLDHIVEYGLSGTGKYFSWEDLDFLYNNWLDSKDKDNWIAPTYKNFDELMQRISPYVISMTQEQLGLPQKQIFDDVYLEFTNTEVKEYTRIEEEMTFEHRNEILDIPNQLALLCRLQQYSGKAQAKIDFIKQMLPEILSNGNKVIIWARFTDELENLYKLFGSEYNTGRLFGNYTDYDGKDILFANPAKGGMGLNLQAYNFNILYSQEFSLQKYIQMLGRTYRTGQKKTVFVKRLFIQNTVDAYIYATLDNKETNYLFFNNSKFIKANTK